MTTLSLLFERCSSEVCPVSSLSRNMVVDGLADDLDHASNKDSRLRHFGVFSMKDWLLRSDLIKLK